MNSAFHTTSSKLGSFVCICLLFLQEFTLWLWKFRFYMLFNTPAQTFPKDQIRLNRFKDNCEYALLYVHVQINDLGLLTMGFTVLHYFINAVIT